MLFAEMTMLHVSQKEKATLSLVNFETQLGLRQKIDKSTVHTFHN